MMTCNPFQLCFGIAHDPAACLGVAHYNAEITCCDLAEARRQVSTKNHVVSSMASTIVVTPCTRLEDHVDNVYYCLIDILAIQLLHDCGIDESEQ